MFSWESHMSSLLSNSMKISLCLFTYFLAASDTTLHSVPFETFSWFLWPIFFWVSWDLWSLLVGFWWGSLILWMLVFLLLCLGTSLTPYSLWGISSIPKASATYKWKIPKSILWCRLFSRPPHSHTQLALEHRSSCRFHEHLKNIFQKFPIGPLIQ